MKFQRFFFFVIVIVTLFVLFFSCKGRKEQGSALHESSSNKNLYTQKMPLHKGPLYLFSWGDKELHRKMIFGDNGESPMDTTFNIVRNPWLAARAKNPEADAGAAGPGLYFSSSWADTINFGSHVLVAKVSPVNGDSFPFPSVSSETAIRKRVEDALLENRGDEPFSANGSKPYVYALNNYSPLWTILVHKPWQEDNIKIEFLWLEALNIKNLANEIAQTIKASNSADIGIVLSSSFETYESSNSPRLDKNSSELIHALYSFFSDDILALLEKNDPSINPNSLPFLLTLIRFFDKNYMGNDSRVARIQKLLLLKSTSNTMFFDTSSFRMLLEFLEGALEGGEENSIETLLMITKNFSMKKINNPSTDTVSLLSPILMAANSSNLKKSIEKYFDTPYDVLEWTKETLSDQQKKDIRLFFSDSTYSRLVPFKKQCILWDSNSNHYKEFPDLYKEWPAAFGRIFKAIDEPIPQ